MKLAQTIIATAFAIGAMLSVQATPTFAALPCNLNDLIYSTEFSDEPTGDLVTQTLMETLEGIGPTDREDATVIDYETPHAMRFRVVSAGENILRCLDYGQSEVLAINATPAYRFSQFGLGNDVPDEALVTDLDATNVYTERVENPLELSNGYYLVDFTACHNDLWMSGEMVFEMYDDDLYLRSTHLTDINPASGESHSVIMDSSGASVEGLNVQNGDLIGFGNERDENIRVTVTADDTGETVFNGGNIGKNFAGPAPKSTFYVRNLDPGEYTATIVTDGGEVFEIRITIDP